MKIDFGSQTPIFLQLSQGLEDEILSGVYREGEQIPSITELAASYKINPATALKGINLLVDAGIVYKKRGIGMFVSQGALQLLKEKDRMSFSAVRSSDGAGGKTPLHPAGNAARLD